MSTAAPDELTCQEIVELVTDLLEQRLEPDERTRFEQHLLYCPGCSAFFEQMRASIRAAARTREAADLPPEAQAALLSAFRSFKKEAP